mmetsp:Transcript_51876/g.130338  ORF Transcript_51876/g.130338 Transcript_51876/m.130338 type:complete len:213 (-) Transcript_51876:94-732(-)
MPACRSARWAGGRGAARFGFSNWGQQGRGGLGCLHGWQCLVFLLRTGQHLGHTHRLRRHGRPSGRLPHSFLDVFLILRRHHARLGRHTADRQLPPVVGLGRRTLTGVADPPLGRVLVLRSALAGRRKCQCLGLAGAVRESGPAWGFGVPPRRSRAAIFLLPLGPGRRQHQGLLPQLAEPGRLLVAAYLPLTRTLQRIPLPNLRCRVLRHSPA